MKFIGLEIALILGAAQANHDFNVASQLYQNLEQLEQENSDFLSRES